jgi:outer membrane cobalamin receptor
LDRSGNVRRALPNVLACQHRRPPPQRAARPTRIHKEVKLNKVPPLRHVACLILAGAGTHGGALAQERPDLTTMPIEQLLNLEVSTASKIPQKISEAPSAVSVITSEDIRRNGYRTLADLLQGVRGIHVSYDRNYSYVGTRASGQPGDLNTRVLVLIDGRRQNDIVYDQGAVGTEFPVDVGLIERVEFVPGPGAAIYGSSAFFGVINVITKNGAAYRGTEVTAGAAAHGARQASATFGTRGANGLDLLLGSSWYDTKGSDLYFPEFDDGTGSRGVASGLDYDRYRRLFAKLSFGGLTADAYLGRRTKGVPTASYGQRFGDPRSRTLDEYAGGGLSWRRDLSDTLELYASAHLSRYRYAGIYIYGPGDGSANADLSTSRTMGAELRVLSTALRGHRIIAGAEHLRDTERSMRNLDLDPPTIWLDDDHPKRRSAIYLQDEMRLGERFILNTGLRHDADSEGGSTTNPRVALLYKATPQMTYKALYGTAYRSANSYERYYASNVDYKLNPHLRSEHIKTYELIAEYFPTDRFRAGASLFQYRFRDLLALTTDPADERLYFSNIDAARSTGLELEAEWVREDGASLKSSASFQQARNGATGDWLGNSPRRLFKLAYATPLSASGMGGAVEYRFTGRRLNASGGQVGGFGIVNLTLLGQPFGKWCELSASLDNLLGKRYADASSEEHFDNATPPHRLQAIGQDGRTWRFQATLRF